MSVPRKSSLPPAPVAPAIEPDLETTAELPVLDVAAYEAATAEVRANNTDTWIVPSASPAPATAANVAGSPSPTSVAEEKRTQLEVSLHALSENLREVEERLKHKDARLAEIEKSLSHADAERSVAQQQTKQLTTELLQARAALAAAEARVAALQRVVEERDAANQTLQGHDKEFEEKLALRDKALALVQRDLTAAQELAATYLESLQSNEGRRGIFEELVTTLEQGGDERVRELESAAARQSALLAERHSELDRIATERTTLISSVNSLELKLAEANTRGTERDSAVRTAQSRCDELEAANNVQRKRVEQLESELATVRSELQQRSAALQEGSVERGELTARMAAGDVRIRELEGRVEEQKEFVRVLQADSNASVARAKELEGDLRAAEDMINRLEAELRGRNARLDELEKTNQEWRTTVEEARTALTDRDSLIRRLEEETANSAVLLGSIQQRLEASGTHEIAPEGDKRLLIRTEGDSEVVHVLGRKTTVGRTPDNDLQIDAKFISRHHAVILAGPAHTIIEDLNSTNGVLINGRRITRQTLKDGDAVVIGKAVFRFAVRPVGERRG